MWAQWCSGCCISAVETAMSFRSVILRALYALTWKRGMLRRIHPRWFRWRQLESSSSIWTVTSPWDQTGSTQGCQGNWQGWLPSHSAIYQHSWLSGEVPEDWRLADVTPIYKKGRKEDPGNYRPVSLTLVPGKVMEQIILGENTWHVPGIEEIRPSQHRFIKGWCMGTVESWPEPLIGHLRRALSQLGEHRWRLFHQCDPKGWSQAPPLLNPI